MLVGAWMPSANQVTKFIVTTDMVTNLITKSFLRGQSLSDGESPSREWDGCSLQINLVIGS